MSRKLISDLLRLLRVMFVTCLIFPISARKVEEAFASFFVFLRFVLKFHPTELVWTQKCFCFSKCFLSNISFGILKLLVFHAVAHLLGTNLVEKNEPSEVSI